MGKLVGAVCNLSAHATHIHTVGEDGREWAVEERLLYYIVPALGRLWPGHSPAQPDPLMA